MSNIRVEDLRQEVCSILKDKIPNPAKEAQLLLMHYLKCDELWILLNKEAQVDCKDELLVLAKRRANQEPLEYITNSVSFYSQTFFIDRGALVPRPETELLIDEVLRQIPDKDAPLEIVEVGVGSGVISIMLARFLKNAKITAIDISHEALKIAAKNIELFDLSDRINLEHGSLLESINRKVDYLVSNPPYIAKDAILEKNLSFEPQQALFGGEGGEEIIFTLLKDYLKKEISFFSCEIGYDQKDKIMHLIQENDGVEIKFYKDLSNFNRGFTIRKTK